MKFCHTKPGKEYYLRVQTGKLRHSIRQQWSQKMVLTLPGSKSSALFTKPFVGWGLLGLSLVLLLGFSWNQPNQTLCPHSYFILSSLLPQFPITGRMVMREQRIWEHTWMNQKCLCVTGSWPSAAPAISISCLFWVIQFQMSQLLPGLELGLVLELVMLAFEMNGKMPTAFSMRRAHQQTQNLHSHPTSLEVASLTTAGLGLGRLWQTALEICVWNEILIYQPPVMTWPHDLGLKAFLLVANADILALDLWIRKALQIFEWSKSLMLRTGVSPETPQFQLLVL